MIEEVRRDVVCQLYDMKKGQPRKYLMVLEQIIEIVEKAPLEQVAGPDES